MLTFTFGSGWTPGAPSTATATPMAKQGWQMATAGWRHRTTPFCDFSCQNFGHPRVIRDPGLVVVCGKTTVKKSNSPTDFFLTLFDFLKDFYENSWFLWLNPGVITSSAGKSWSQVGIFLRKIQVVWRWSCFLNMNTYLFLELCLAIRIWVDENFLQKLSRARTSKSRFWQLKSSWDFSLLKSLGKMFTHFWRCHIFAKWVGLVQPPTRTVQKGGGFPRPPKKSWRLANQKSRNPSGATATRGRCGTVGLGDSWGGVKRWHPEKW